MPILICQSDFSDPFDFIQDQRFNAFFQSKIQCHAADAGSMYTHINDNLGVSAENGAITWLDDLHLLPFDGVLDVKKCMADIAKTGYCGELTFELSVKSKPGRNENDRYAAMGPKAYIKEAYERAVQVRDIFDSEKIKNNKNRT